jgi:hypothetical protein
VLAHHYTEAGLIAQAYPIGSRQGGDPSSARQYGSISHLTKGLEWLKTLPARA